LRPRTGAGDVHWRSSSGLTGAMGRADGRGQLFRIPAPSERTTRRSTLPSRISRGRGRRARVPSDRRAVPAVPRPAAELLRPAAPRRRRRCSFAASDPLTLRGGGESLPRRGRRRRGRFPRCGGSGDARTAKPPRRNVPAGSRESVIRSEAEIAPVLTPPWGSRGARRQGVRVGSGLGRSRGQD